MQGKSGLSELYADLPEDKLPAHLDAPILAEAHRAVGARPGGKPRRSWVIPLSVAASLFVVVIIGRQLSYLLPGDAVPGQANQQDRQRLAKMDQAAPAKNAPTREMQEQKQAHAPEKNQVAVPPAEPAAMAPAAKASRPPEAPAPQGAAPEPAAAMAKPAPAAETKPVGAMRVAPAAPAASPPAVAEQRAPLQDQAASGRVQVFKSEKKSKSRSEGIVADQAAPPAETAAQMAAPAPVQPAAEADGYLKEDASTANLPPKEWLARIRQLKQQGKLDEARKELAAFKKRYPDYPVPKTLEMR